MRIIYARMKEYGWTSTPSDAVARELERLGHTITIVDTLEMMPVDKHDVVWSPYESVTNLGHGISQRLGIPHIAHIEWIPPWRCMKNINVSLYGFKKNSPEILNFDAALQFQKGIISAYKKASVKTLSDLQFIPYLTTTFGDLGEIKVRHQSIDHRTVLKAKETYFPKRENNTIITIARAVPNKRLDLVCDVINRLKTKVTWRIVGDGPEIENIKKSMKNENVTLDLKGVMWGWNRLYELLKAKICLGSWSGMPPMEAALLGCTPILYEPKVDPVVLPNGSIFNDLYGDSVSRFPFDNLEDAVQCVENELKKPQGQTLKETNIVDRFLNNELGMTTSEQNAKNLVNLMEK